MLSARALAISLLVLNGLLQVLDFGTTGLALNMGGQEGNPAVVAIMGTIGVGGWVVVKALLALLLVGFILPAAQADLKVVRVMNQALVPMTLLMAWVVGNNAVLLARFHG